MGTAPLPRAPREQRRIWIEQYRLGAKVPEEKPRARAMMRILRFLEHRIVRVPFPTFEFKMYFVSKIDNATVYGITRLIKKEDSVNGSTTCICVVSDEPTNKFLVYLPTLIKYQYLLWRGSNNWVELANREFDSFLERVFNALEAGDLEFIKSCLACTHSLVSSGEYGLRMQSGLAEFAEMLSIAKVIAGGVDRRIDIRPEEETILFVLPPTMPTSESEARIIARMFEVAKEAYTRFIGKKVLAALFLSGEAGVVVVRGVEAAAAAVIDLYRVVKVLMGEEYVRRIVVEVRRGNSVFSSLLTAVERGGETRECVTIDDVKLLESVRSEIVRLRAEAEFPELANKLSKVHSIVEKSVSKCIVYLMNNALAEFVTKASDITNLINIAVKLKYGKELPKSSLEKFMKKYGVSACIDVVDSLHTLLTTIFEAAQTTPTLSHISTGTLMNRLLEDIETLKSIMERLENLNKFSRDVDTLIYIAENIEKEFFEKAESLLGEVRQRVDRVSKALDTIERSVKEVSDRAERIRERTREITRLLKVLVSAKRV